MLLFSLTSNLEKTKILRWALYSCMTFLGREIEKVVQRFQHY